jgi:membrane-associated protease RseP (regulator of RpoE activity)
MPMRMAILKHWDEGLIYMACLIAILLTHEMGHFLTTLFHRIPASFPYFILFPISPFGTMGAVIGMDGSRANRPQTFDIGLAGPLAGLVVAIPILMYGIQQLDLSQPEYGAMGCDPPLAVKLAFEYWRRPPGYEAGDVVWMGQMNPYFMAGWVGLFITGMNMLPLSQLDGGHIIYTLFGRSRALWIARGFMVTAIAYTVYSDLIRNIWLMVALLLLIGPDHPPTRDDSAPMGWFRYALGGVSLLIPVFCFPLRIIVVEGGF